MRFAATRAACLLVKTEQLSRPHFKKFIEVSFMEKNRLEAFSDCVIAFAITLLILEIHIPELGAGVGNAAMLKTILNLLPNFAVYVVSFVVCTVWWVSHHTFVHDLRLVDRRLLWINNLFLMLIAFIPFPTGLLGHHAGQPIATAFYGIVCAFTGLTFWLMRWYAFMPGRLARMELPIGALQRSVRISLLSPLLYLCGATISFSFPIFALFLYAAIPAYFAFGNLGQSAAKVTGNDRPSSERGLLL
jgi:uncharacterized membrane protein